MKVDNYFEMTIDAKSVNEMFVRSAVASFCVQLNPSLEEINDIKTAVSEAFTNSVVHAYDNSQDGKVRIIVSLIESLVHIEIIDKGVGIDDIDKAREPFYTTRAAEERSGMGFTVMETLMDSVFVEKNLDHGLIVLMEKKIAL